MLTAKKEMFARKIVEGMSQADAYRAAYSTKNMANKTIWENASRLMADGKVSARVNELREQLAEESVMKAEERLRLLTRIARGEEKEKVPQIVNGEAIEVEVSPAIKTRLNALDIMNRMTGEYELKVKGSLGVKLEDLI